MVKFQLVCVEPKFLKRGLRIIIPVQINARHLHKMKILMKIAKQHNKPLWLLKLMLRLKVWKQNRNAQKSLKVVKKAQKAEEGNRELPKAT